MKVLDTKEGMATKIELQVFSPSEDELLDID